MDFRRWIADFSAPNPPASLRFSLAAAMLLVTVALSGCRWLPARQASLQTQNQPTARLLAEHRSPGGEPSAGSAVTAVSLSTAFSASVPPQPSPLSQLGGQLPEWPLEIHEALAAALSSNRGLIVNQFAQQIERHQVIIEESIFDPSLGLGTQWLEDESQISNVVQGPGGNTDSALTNQLGRPKGLTDQVRISRKLASGGDVMAGMSVDYQYSDPGGAFLRFNPSLRSTAQIEFTQPLLRGSGAEITRLQIRMARNTFAAERYRLEAQIREIVSRTAMAYWELYGARARLDSRDKGVREAHTVWNQELDKLALGASSGPEVATARAQLEQFRVRRAQAQQDVADAERQLRMLMAVPLQDGRQILPVTSPLMDARTLDWQDSVIAALQERPEIRLQKSTLQLAVLRHTSAHDNLRPDIRGYAGWGISGVDDQLDRSLRTMTTADYQRWWTGIVYETEIGQRAVRSRHAQSCLAVARQRAALELTEQNILEELHAAYQHVTNAWQVLQLAGERRKAATEVVTARRDMHALGEMSLQDYLAALSEWEQSIADQRLAVSDYNSAIVEWEFAKGSILQYQHIDFSSAATVSDGTENIPDNELNIPPPVPAVPIQPQEPETDVQKP